MELCCCGFDATLHIPQVHIPATQQVVRRQTHWTDVMLLRQVRLLPPLQEPLVGLRTGMRDHAALWAGNWNQLCPTCKVGHNRPVSVHPKVARKAVVGSVTY